MAIVYKHIRLDTNEVFYIGIGTNRRAYEKRDRNRHWNNIVKKAGYSIEITHKNITREEAVSIEKYLIAFYGRADLGLGGLVNMTDGGDGGNNQSEETKKLRSEIMSGDRNHRYGKTLSDENKKLLSELWKGRVFSEDTRIKLGKSKKGNTYRAKMVIDIDTGTVYNSVTEASVAIGQSAPTLSQKLNNRIKNNTCLVFLKEFNKAA